MRVGGSLLMRVGFVSVRCNGAPGRDVPTSRAGSEGRSPRCDDSMVREHGASVVMDDSVTVTRAVRLGQGSAASVLQRVLWTKALVLLARARRNAERRRRVPL